MSSLQQAIERCHHHISLPSHVFVSRSAFLHLMLLHIHITHRNPWLCCPAFDSIRFDLVSPLILVFLFYYTMPLLFRILHVAPTLHSFLIILNPPRVAFRNYYPIARVFVISFPLFFHDPVLSIIYYYCIIYSLLLSTYIYSMATTLNIGSLTVIAATSSSPNDNTSILFCFFCALLFVWNDFYNLIGPKWNRLNCVCSVLFQFLSEFHFLLLKSRHEA